MKNADLYFGALKVGVNGYPDDAPSIEYCGVYVMPRPDEAEPCLDEPSGRCAQCGKPYCSAHEGGEPNTCVECVGR